MSRLVAFFGSSAHYSELLRVAENMADSIWLDENATIESLRAAREFRDFLIGQRSKPKASLPSRLRQF